jgi:hypothetical protein
LARLRFEHAQKGIASAEDMDINTQNFPGNEVDDYYQQIIDDISTLPQALATRAFRALSWILHARIPLNKQVLLEALDAASVDNILVPCRSLVILSEVENVFQFSHTTTVLAFLNRRDINSKIPSGADLALTCLKDLDSKGWDYQSHSPWGFFSYVRSCWMDHVRDEESHLFVNGLDGLEHFKFLTSESNREKLFNHFSILSLAPDLDSDNFTILHIAAWANLPKLCETLFDAKARSIKRLYTTDF